MLSFLIITDREDKLAERAKALKVNAGTEPGAALGPVISKQVHTLTVISTLIGDLQLGYWRHSSLYCKITMQLFLFCQVASVL